MGLTKKRIMIDKEKCMACYSCSLACMQEYNKGGGSFLNVDLMDKKNSSRSHIELSQDQKPTPIVCRHCDRPECVYTCMSGAMTKDEETGFVLHDSKQCASCFMCVMSCPFGVLDVDDAGGLNILKCDMCYSTRGEDGTPACVEVCPTGAISIIELDGK